MNGFDVLVLRPAIQNGFAALATFVITLVARPEWTIMPLIFGLIAALVFSATIASFGAYFNDRISGRAGWTAILFNGAVTILIFMFAHSFYGIVYAGPLPDQTEIARDYANVAYFSVVTFTTLGYGDFQPSEPARLLAALEAMLGYVYLGLLVGAALHWAARPSGNRQ